MSQKTNINSLLFRGVGFLSKITVISLTLHRTFVVTGRKYLVTGTPSSSRWDLVETNQPDQRYKWVTGPRTRENYVLLLLLLSQSIFKSWKNKEILCKSINHIIYIFHWLKKEGKNQKLNWYFLKIVILYVLCASLHSFSGEKLG